MPQTINLTITGMHCRSCIKRVTMALQNIPGVHIHMVELGSAQITFEPNQATTAQILDAVSRIGFLAEVKA